MSSFARCSRSVTTLFAGPPSRRQWTKLAHSEPSEELLGASAGGKLYVSPGSARLEARRWSTNTIPPRQVGEEKAMRCLAPRRFRRAKGKIYAFGGFVLPSPARLSPNNTTCGCNNM